MRTLAEIQAQWDQDREDSGWRVIDEYPLYEISMYGTIRRIKSRKEVRSVRTDAGLAVKLLLEGNVYKAELVRTLVQRSFPNRTWIEPKIEPKIVVESKKPKRVSKPKSTKPKPPPLVDLEGEIWKPIPDFPNYEVSNHCRVKNIVTMQAVHIAKSGTVLLYVDGKPSSRSVKKLHRLVFSEQIEFEDEEWAPSQFPNYEVSNKGRVRHMGRKYILPEVDGYVSLSVDKKSKKIRTYLLFGFAWGRKD